MYSKSCQGRYLWVYGVCEAPDENEGWRHDDLGCMVDALVKREFLGHGHSHDTLDGRVPLDTRNLLLLGELQVRK